jgi:hypothetical protein
MNPSTTLNPVDILFQVASNLTGGLINDVTTALVAMLGIGFICMGIDYLKDVFENHINAANEKHHINKAHEYLGRSKYYESGDEENDVLAAVYKKKASNHISKAAKI